MSGRPSVIFGLIIVVWLTMLKRFTTLLSVEAANNLAVLSIYV